ncbi:MAG: DUF4197 domain-containing protein [Cytophagales bacterium]|nr:DUF4197 domain-containing protein [Cytophagales bacterium]MDW8383319.1 DUF4197 domain-containing protein [Flammeovirgaceae bacterium]
MQGFLIKLWFGIGIWGLSACSLDLLSPQNSQLSESEVVAGLKQALNVGTDSAVTKLMKPNGFLGDSVVRILLPDEIQRAIVQLRSNSEGEKVYQLLLKTFVEDSLIKSFNRAAEDAVVEALPIFKNAITSMNISDAFGILRGSDSAATTYLKQKTYDSLKFRFQPKIDVSLNKKLIGSYSANEMWTHFYEKYNQAIEIYNIAARAYNLLNSSNPLPILSRLQSVSLSEYVTTKALNGVFIKIKDIEKEIRLNPQARVTELLRKVFGSK